MPVNGPLEQLLETDRRSTEQESQAGLTVGALKAEALAGAEARRKDRLARETAVLETAFSADKASLEEGQARVLDDFGRWLGDQKKDLAGFETVVRRALTGGG